VRPRDAIVHASSLLDQGRDIDDPQRRFRIAGPTGRLQDRGLHHRQLPIIHLRRPAWAPAIAKPSHAALVVPDHPIAQRLPVHAGQLCSHRPDHAVECIGDRQHPPPNASIALATRQPPQLLSRQIGMVTPMPIYESPL
jgi:hypothetical protein